MTLFETRNGAQLRDAVASGRLSLYYVVSVPRSNSTALMMALTQAPQIAGLLNEPFVRADHRAVPWDSGAPAHADHFDDGCAHILERAVDAARTLASAKGAASVGLCVHDHAKDLTEAQFRALASLSRHLFFAVREPLAQSASFLARMCNEAVGIRGRDTIRADAALALLKDADAFARHAEANIATIDRDHASRISGLDPAAIAPGNMKALHAALVARCLSELTKSWENLTRYAAIAREERMPANVSDSATMLATPREHLAALCEVSGLTFTPDMVDNWRKGTGDDFHCIISRPFGPGAATNAWNGPARTSRGITCHSGSVGAAPVFRDALPAEATEYLDRVSAQYAATLERIPVG